MSPLRYFKRIWKKWLTVFFFRNASGDSEEDGCKQDIYKKCAI